MRLVPILRDSCPFCAVLRVHREVQPHLIILDASCVVVHYDGTQSIVERHGKGQRKRERNIASTTKHLGLPSLGTGDIEVGTHE